MIPIKEKIARGLARTARGVAGKFTRGLASGSDSRQETEYLKTFLVISPKRYHI